MSSEKVVHDAERNQASEGRNSYEVVPIACMVFLLFVFYYLVIPKYLNNRGNKSG
jgi:hypothetical protein